MRYMTPGHSEAQKLFLQIGAVKGHTTRVTFSSDLPTDGVWLVTSGIGDDLVPLVAIEVIVSEDVKRWRGSIATLEAVSPATGILLLQDEEIRRRMIRKGTNPVETERLIEQTRRSIQHAISRSRQRLVVMTMSQLRNLRRLA